MTDIAPAESETNAEPYSVSELAFALKRTIEDAYGFVRVRGELSKVTFHSSGHVYLDLKDERASISGVVWKTQVSRLAVRPQTGLEVVVTGKLTTYPGRSQYQLIIESMAPAGVGALLAQLERLKAKLAAEGLFEAGRKKPLPSMPAVIGVITSPTGAVIRDILHRIRDRWPCRVIVWPSVMQGEAASALVAAAIRGFNALPAGGPIPRPDVLIVARGGGSVEDLWPFNDEALARTAAASDIPLISAVGHETDTTLIDFVADRRAPTPTAAAEMAIPPRTDLLAALAQTGARLIGALNRLTQERRLRLSRAERGLPDLPALLGTARQRLDDRAERLRMALPNLVRGWAARLTLAGRGLPDLRALVGAARQRLDDRSGRMRQALPGLVRGWAARLTLAGSTLAGALRHTLAARRDRAVRVLARVSPAPLAGRLREARARLEGAAGRLESVSPLAVLQRGYALVTDPVGHPLTTAAAVRPGARLRVRFADGEVGATADGGGKPDRQGRLSL